MPNISKNFIGPNGVMMRPCLDCGPQPLNQFYRNEPKKHTESRCRTCLAKRRREWYTMGKTSTGRPRRTKISTATHQLYVTLEHMQFLIDLVKDKPGLMAKEIRIKCENRLAKEKKKLGMIHIAPPQDQVKRVLSTSKFAKYAQAN